MLKGLFLLLYYGLSVYGVYSLGKTFIIEKSIEVLPFFITIISLIIIFIIFAILYSKQNYDVSTIYYFKLSNYISFPFSYGILWILSNFISDSSYREIITFKFENSIFISIEMFILFNAVCSIIPILISTIIFFFLSRHKRNIKIKEEISYQTMIDQEKKETQRLNDEIEYYSKLKELDTLLSSGTINDTKYNSLKENLKKQYNINDE